MPIIEIDGILLEIAPQFLTARLERELHGGKFEQKEAEAVRLHLTPQDHVLEIGTGMGFITMVLAQITAGKNIVSIEANPEIIGSIQNNFALNGTCDVTLLNYAIVPQAGQSEVVLFVPKAFYAASIEGETMPFARQVAVPAMSLDQALATHRPTVLVCDAEGAEVGFFKQELPERLRLIILEVHPNKHQAAEIEAIFERLQARGFRYSLDGSNWPIMCFKRG